MGDDVEGLASELQALGPFAQAQLLAATGGPGDGWLPVASLRDADVVVGRVERVREALTARAPQGRVVAPRVAASTMHLGLVARLLAVEVAVRTLTGTAVCWEQAWWQDVLGMPVPIALPPPVAQGDAGSAVADGSLAGRVAVVPAAVVGLTELVDATYRLGAHVAWGNVASGANSAAMLLASVRPDLAARALAVADELLSDPRMEGGALRAGPGFRRHSCCLVHQVSGDSRAVCGDCVLQGR